MGGWQRARRKSWRRSRASVLLRSSAAEEGALLAAPPRSASGDRLRALQGKWLDNIGLYIEVKDAEAIFSDGTGAWPITDDGDVLWVRGARLRSSDDPDKLTWDLRHGVAWVWRRQPPLPPEVEAWSRLFLAYKDRRLQIRYRLWYAVTTEEYGEAAQAFSAWLYGEDAPLEAPAEQQIRLAAGRHIVPGVCIRHRRSGYRAIVLACEPWGRAPTVGQMKLGRGGLPRKSQPVYHCLVDERDQEGGRLAFVTEEDIEVCEKTFPVRNRFASDLLMECPEIKGYLPGPGLLKALSLHKDGGPLCIWK